MGYTSGTAMDDRGLRDIERWRDKIEVRLDNRQVFFLFFGSALVACMLFVLGVIVGKRLESRGRAVSPEIEDPLALLDKVATTPKPAQSGVTFPQALFGSAKNSSTDKHAKKSVALAEPAPESTSPPARESKPAENPAKAAEAGTKPAEVAKPAPQPSPAKPSDSKPAESKESKPIAVPTIAAASEAKNKGHFALQLSSFQDKSEAEAFAQKFQGERLYMVISEIPGKGTWYRVRVGDYASAKDAMTAKQSFEHKHNVIAYVAQK